MYSQERVSLWLGSFVALAGIAVLWGWALDWPALKRVLPAFPEMKVNTAACFALGGFALCANADDDRKPARWWRRSMATVCATLVLLVGGLTLGQQLAGWDFGIDDVLIRNSSNAASNLDGDRMGPVTALCFMVIGSALLLLPRKSHFFSCVVEALAAVVALVALLPALGYAFNATELRLFLGTDSIALHTVGAFVALVLGVFIVTARRGWIQVITSSTFGSIAGRYLLPAVFVAPVGLCYLHYQGRNLGWFSAELGFIISLVLSTSLFFALTLWAISALNRVDRARQNNEEALQELAHNLQERVEQRTAEIAEINHQLRAEIAVRTAAEAALQKNEESYRTIAQSLPQLVWTCTADGRCDWLGPQWGAYAGVPENELPSDRWTQQLHPDDRERAAVAWDAAPRSGLNFDMDFRVRRADGVYRWFKARAVPLHDATGAIVKWFGTSTDVHDLRRPRPR